jgi:hypothetical protein
LKSGVLACLFVVVLVGGTCLPNAVAAFFFNESGSNQDPQTSMGVPLYSFENSTWTQALSGSPAVKMIVMNPDNGPGSSQDPRILAFVQVAQRQGVKVLGYVDTQWAEGKVTVEQAKINIGEYYSWYHVNGIMFDDVNDTCAASAVSYYSSLYYFTKAEPGQNLVVLNPGTATGSCYLPISDILVVFEGDYDNFTNSYLAANWTAPDTSMHSMAVVYNATSVSEMQNAIKLASQRNIGWVYATDSGRSLASLPSYFCEELNAMNYSISSCISPPDPTPLTGFLEAISLVAVVLAVSAVVIKSHKISRSELRNNLG